MTTQRELVDTLRDNLLYTASGIEADKYEKNTDPPTTSQESLHDTVEPISRAMRDVTEGPRALDQLKSDLESWKARQVMVDRAQKRIDELLEQTEDGRDLREELEGFKQFWEERKAEVESEVQVRSHQFKERQESTPTGWDAVSIGGAGRPKF